MIDLENVNVIDIVASSFKLEDALITDNLLIVKVVAVLSDVSFMLYNLV
jgi:hypothetical protein